MTEGTRRKSTGRPAAADSGETEAERDAEAARQELQDLVYSVSHDLREPLRMVRSYVSLIERRLGEEISPEIRDFMEFAVDGATRMDKMLEGLLTFSRVQTHGGAIAPTSTEDALQEAWARLEDEAEAAGATLVTDPIPDVKADPAQLERLFYELLSNAVRFRSKGHRPRIEVRGTRKDGMVRIEVEDDGIGMDEADVDRAFAFFQRLHTRTEYPEGVGMGLPIARRIAHRHDGEVGIRSEKGKGTTAWATLPAA